MDETNSDTGILRFVRLTLLLYIILTAVATAILALMELSFTYWIRFTQSIYQLARIMLILLSTARRKRFQ